MDKGFMPRTCEEPNGKAPNCNAVGEVCSDFNSGVAWPEVEVEGVLPDACVGDGGCWCKLWAVEFLDSGGRAWPSSVCCAGDSRACCGRDKRLFNSARGVVALEPACLTGAKSVDIPCGVAMEAERWCGWGL